MVVRVAEGPYANEVIYAARWSYHLIMKKETWQDSIEAPVPANNDELPAAPANP